jgi:hypothetical protein
MAEQAYYFLGQGGQTRLEHYIEHDDRGLSSRLERPPSNTSRFVKAATQEPQAQARRQIVRTA